MVLSLCYPRWNEIDYDLEKCYHLGKQKSWSMPLATENHAKKVRVTPRTKNCISGSSNLTRINKRLVVESSSDQEIHQAPLEGEHMKKEV